MGYKEGAGLGKKGKGRVDIVEASKQRGRRGLGLKTAGFEPSTEVVWAGDEKVCSMCDGYDGNLFHEVATLLVHQQLLSSQFRTLINVFQSLTQHYTERNLYIYLK